MTPAATPEALEQALAVWILKRWPTTQWQAAAKAKAIVAGPLAPVLADLQRVTTENENLRKHLEICALAVGYSPIASYPISTSVHRLRKQSDTATAEAASLRAENEKLKQEISDTRTELDALIQEVLKNG